MIGSRYKILLFACLAALTVAGSGCSTVRPYGDQIRPIYSSYSQGKIEAAAERAETGRFKRRFRSNDRLLWTMEAGKLFHAADDFEKSNSYFEKAEEIVTDFEERPEYNLRAGAAQLGAVATNPAAIPYRGSYADKIMINTYKAMNYLAMGDLEAARVEIRRSHERQRQALDENEKAVEKAKQEARSRNLTSGGTYDNPELREAAPVDPATAEAYADFSNPFTTFLSGIVALADRDPARAEVDFRLLASLPIQNSFVKRDLERIQQHLNGQRTLDRPRVYVIFENGLGPTKEEMRVDLVLPDIGYTGFAFPRIVPHPARVDTLGIVPGGDGQRLQTQRIASMDQIVATEFQARMPATLMRTLTSVIAKEVGAKQLTHEFDGIGLLLGSLYKLAVNRADTRAWQTLGKEFQVASFDYPESGILALSLLGRNKNELMTRREVKLPEGDFVLVFARSVNQHDLRIATRALR